MEIQTALLLSDALAEKGDVSPASFIMKFLVSH